MRYKTLIYAIIIALSAALLAGCGGGGGNGGVGGNTLSGKVIDGVSGNPLTGVRVAIGTSSTTTRTDGTFTLTGLSLGSGVTSFQLAGYEIVTVNVDIVAGANPLPADVNMAPIAGDPPVDMPRTVDGTISLSVGSKVSGAVVTLLSGATQIDQMTTGADGLYFFWAPAGNYTVRVAKIGYTVVNTPVTISDIGAVVTLNISL